MFGFKSCKTPIGFPTTKWWDPICLNISYHQTTTHALFKWTLDRFTLDRINILTLHLVQWVRKIDTLRYFNVRQIAYVSQTVSLTMVLSSSLILVHHQIILTPGPYSIIPSFIVGLTVKLLVTPLCFSLLPHVILLWSFVNTLVV